MLRTHLINLLIVALALGLLGYAFQQALKGGWYYLLAFQGLLGLYLVLALSSTLMRTYREWRYQPSRLR